MNPSTPPSLFFLSVIAIAITLACGSQRVVSNCVISNGTNESIPQSVTLCPATADAQDYPEGKVPFVATGYYASPPSPLTLQSPAWGACFQSAPTTEVSITSKGVASCASGASGTFSVFASVPLPCDAISACGGGCQVSGYAQLTCP